MFRRVQIAAKEIPHGDNKAVLYCIVFFCTVKNARFRNQVSHSGKRQTTGSQGLRLHQWLGDHHRLLRVELHCKARCEHNPWRQCRLSLNIQLDNGNGRSHTRCPLECLTGGSPMPQMLSISKACHKMVDSWCFEPSRPQRITSGLKTNFNLSPRYSFHKSMYHKTLFLKPQLKLYPQFRNPNQQEQ